MTDIEDLLTTDARRWRADQHLDRDLDLAVGSATRRTSAPHRRGLVVAAAAAAVVAISGGAAFVVDRTTTPDRPASTNSPDRTSGTSPDPDDLPALQPSLAGSRTLLASSGRYNRTFRVDPLARNGEITAVCLGGGTIKVSMPGRGGFDLDCTGTPAAVSLPTLGTTVTITGVRDQVWRIAVFGR